MATTVLQYLTNMGHSVKSVNGRLYDSTNKPILKDGRGRYYVHSSSGNRLYFTENGGFEKNLHLAKEKNPSNLNGSFTGLLFSSNNQNQLLSDITGGKELSLPSQGATKSRRQRTIQPQRLNPVAPKTNTVASNTTQEESKGLWDNIKDRLNQFAKLMGELTNHQSHKAFIPPDSNERVELAQAANGLPILQADGTWVYPTKEQQFSAKKGLVTSAIASAATPLTTLMPLNIMDAISNLGVGSFLWNLGKDTALGAGLDSLMSWYTNGNVSSVGEGLRNVIGKYTGFNGFNENSVLGSIGNDVYSFLSDAATPGWNDIARTVNGMPRRFSLWQDWLRRLENSIDSDGLYAGRGPREFAMATVTNPTRASLIPSTSAPSTASMGSPNYTSSTSTLSKHRTSSTTPSNPSTTNRPTTSGRSSTIEFPQKSTEELQKEVADIINDPNLAITNPGLYRELQENPAYREAVDNIVNNGEFISRFSKKSPVLPDGYAVLRATHEDITRAPESRFVWGIGYRGQGSPHVNPTGSASTTSGGNVYFSDSMRAATEKYGTYDPLLERLALEDWKEYLSPQAYEYGRLLNRIAANAMDETAKGSMRYVTLGAKPRVRRVIFPYLNASEDVLLDAFKIDTNYADLFRKSLLAEGMPPRFVMTGAQLYNNPNYALWDTSRPRYNHVTEGMTIPEEFKGPGFPDWDNLDYPGLMDARNRFYAYARRPEYRKPTDFLALGERYNTVLSKEESYVNRYNELSSKGNLSKLDKLALEEIERELVNIRTERRAIEAEISNPRLVDMLDYSHIAGTLGGRYIFPWNPSKRITIFSREGLSRVPYLLGLESRTINFDKAPSLMQMQQRFTKEHPGRPFIITNPVADPFDNMRIYTGSSSGSFAYKYGGKFRRKFLK